MRYGTALVITWVVAHSRLRAGQTHRGCILTIYREVVGITIGRCQIESLSLCHLPLQTTSKAEVEIVRIGELVVVNGINLRWRIIPTIYRKLIVRIAVIKEDVTVELRPIALAPSIRVTYGENLRCSDSRLSIYRE